MWGDGEAEMFPFFNLWRLIEISIVGGCTFTWNFFLQIAGRWKGLCWHWRVHRDTWCVFSVLLKHSRLILLQMQWGVLWTCYRWTYLQEARQDRTLACLYEQVLCSKYVYWCIAVLAHSPGPHECCCSWFWLQGWIYVLLWCQCQDNIQVCFLNPLSPLFKVSYFLVRRPDTEVE